MIFLKPTILRDSSDSRRSTRDKYYSIRDKQLEQHRYGIQLMSGDEVPVLPDLKDFEDDLEDRVMP